MGLRLLLVSALLSINFHTRNKVDAQTMFTIRSVSLTIEPGANVTRGTNVTVRCRAAVSSSGPETLTREYSVYRDGTTVYTKTTGSSEDFLYPLPDARVSNSGKYKCKISIQSRAMESDARKLTVTGLSDPVLHLNKRTVDEGETVTATCSAPGETGSFFFSFYEGSREIDGVQTNNNQAETQLQFSSAGVHRVHCSYSVFILPDAFRSRPSSQGIVSVRELTITPYLTVSPQSNIFEGDPINVSCSIRGFASRSVELHLSQGNNLLGFGYSEINHSMTAPPSVPRLMFECRLSIGNVMKVSTNNVSVSELFSTPSLTVTPAEVFQRQDMMLTCKSESYATERIHESELIYTLDPDDYLSYPGSKGNFSSKVPLSEFNYTCSAQAKGIKKTSKMLTLRPKVFVSTPSISVSGEAILGRTVLILCESDRGSLPITYNLVKNFNTVASKVVRLPFEKALFPITLNTSKEINQYMCEATNSHQAGLLGGRLNVDVIVPVSGAILFAVPGLDDISEGHQLELICKVSGSPPFTFKWYRHGNNQPLNTTTSIHNNVAYQVPVLSKEHSGKYFCRASNPANVVVQSEEVNIEVHMALWKKALIGGAVLLVGSVLLMLMCVLLYKSKRVKVDRAAVSVWTERKPDAAVDEESSMVTNEPDVEYTEVVHPRSSDPARGPPRKGTDTVYSELQNAPHGAADHHDYGSVEYAELNSEQPEINQYHPEVNNFQDLPEPVD